MIYLTRNLQAMKKTALYQKHIDLGAKMVPFAGYEMPVQYAGVKQEHKQVREGVGIFDVSHMGEFFIEGPHAIDLIQKISANDASKLFDGKAQYSYMPNAKGGVIDDLIIYRINEEKYLLVVNASNIEKDWDWIKQHDEWETQMTNASEDYSLFAIQGPKAIEAVQSLTDVNLNELKFYTFTIDTFAGQAEVIISATGYTGAGGFEIYVKNESASAVWDAVMEAGKSFGIQPIGLAARDTLRLEMGYCLYGNDIDDSTSPIAAGLGWVTKFTKDFINREEIEKQKTEGTPDKLVGFKLVGKGIPRHDYPIVDADENVIGRVTSGTMSPLTNEAIGMGYVNKAFSKPESTIYIQVRNKSIEAKVQKPPFIEK